MTENEQNRPSDAEVAPDQAAPAEGKARQTSEEAACEEAIEQLAETSVEVERLEAEKANLTDRLLRLAAEMDNLRRRTERDITDARKYSVARFAGDMLVVGDNLKRALDAVPAERRESDEAIKALIEGVEVTRREMDRLLEKNGITRIAALGERFDPHLHQAVFEVPSDDVPARIVVEVMQDGYQIGDRVLRAAMVGVSKNGAKPEAQAGDEGGSAA
jgi:molecular chaperone GrpE